MTVTSPLSGIRPDVECHPWVSARGGQGSIWSLTFVLKGNIPRFPWQALQHQAHVRA